ncbi:abortive infection family protein [Actinacidiphila glaucinigra]|uniref:abortive infection family protein n=1 Tax=Actinacidiphila glaucinigra TaxID=235986 RepID=UPI003D8BD60E
MIKYLLQEPLPRADGLQDEQWQAINEGFDRLRRAVDADDRPLIVGAAKELVEGVARVILVSYDGRTVPDQDPYDKVLGAAHKVIEHAVSLGIPRNDPLRQIPESAKKMAGQLRELRNSFGTGHGRSIVHEITDEVIEASVHASLLWVRWALARLHTALHGALAPLIRDLGDGIFYGGDLASRLASANIPDLDQPDQRRLGLAVGQRSARQTVNVRVEGIDAISLHPERWPDEYRSGALHGLFLNEDGQVFTYPYAIDSAVPALLNGHTAPNRLIQDLASKLASASWSVSFQNAYQDALQTMHRTTPTLPEEARAPWTKLIEELKQFAPEAA